jgi:hypothetical protein
MKGLSRESRSLIDAARDGDDPSAADRKRVRSALARKLALGVAAGAVAATASHAAAGGVAAGTGGAASGAASAGVVAAGAAGGGSIVSGTVAAGIGGLGAKLLVSVAIVGALGAGTVGYARHEAARRTEVDARSTVAAPIARPALVMSGAAPPSARAPAASLPVAPLVTAVTAVTASVPAPPAAVSPAIPAPAAAKSVPAPSSASTAAAPSELDAELALLQEAHGALQMNDGARALRLLEEHTRRFPNGALGEESEAARVFALCQVGRADEARDVAGRFLREHPRSPLAPRVSRACDGAGSGAPTF